MQTNISGQHLEITPSLRTFVLEKLEKLERHAEKIQSIHVVLKVEEKLRKLGEATLTIKNDVFHANAESSDMHATIEMLVDKLDAQLETYKGKQLNHRREERKHRRDEKGEED